jgi:hypothetical protein
LTEFLEFRSVSKRFGTIQAVNDVSLGIRKGEFFTFLGAELGTGMDQPWLFAMNNKAPPSSGAWGPAVPPGLLLLPLRPGVDETLVERHRVLGGDALGVGSFSRP